MGLLEANDENEMTKLSQKLHDENIQHKLGLNNQKTSQHV